MQMPFGRVSSFPVGCEKTNYSAKNEAMVHLRATFLFRPSNSAERYVFWPPFRIFPVGWMQCRILAVSEGEEEGLSTEVLLRRTRLGLLRRRHGEVVARRAIRLEEFVRNR